MKKILSDIKQINNYILNPKYDIDKKFSQKEKWQVLFSAILYDLVVSILITFSLIYAIDYFIVPLEETDNLNKFSLFELFFLFVFIAPIFEETIFRLPLKFKRNFLTFFDTKKQPIQRFWKKYFKPIFYIFSFSFALIHITNFSNNQLIFYVLAPLIVISQGFGGLILGYIRMHLGFFWGILYHSLFNFLIMSCFILLQHNSTSLEKETKTINLKIYELSFSDGKEKIMVNFNNETISSINWKNETFQKLLDTIYNNQYKTYDNHLAKIKLITTKPISKEEFLKILKEEYRIVEKN